MSTTLLIGMMPTVSKRCAIHVGLGPIFTPRIARAVYRGQRSGHSIRTETRLSTGVVPSTGLAAGSFRLRFHRTAISRATPMWPKQSGRLLVTSRSMAKSPATSSVPSWFRPEKVSLRSSSSSGISSGTYCFSQFQETIMGGIGVRDWGFGARVRVFFPNPDPPAPAKTDVKI